MGFKKGIMGNFMTSIYKSLVNVKNFERNMKQNILGCKINSLEAATKYSSHVFLWWDFLHISFKEVISQTVLG